jgi:hypothetical protein
MPKWHIKDSADMLEGQRNWCTSNNTSTTTTRTLPTPPGIIVGTHGSPIQGVQFGDLYILTSLPNAPFSNYYAYSTNHKHNQIFIPDLLTNNGTSTG